jgi:hypothetical protein
MEFIFGIALVYGLAFALVRGTEHAGRALQSAYRTNAMGRQGRRQGGKPYATGRSSTAGAKLGAVVATGATGLVMAGRGFAEGWRTGWPEGRRRAHERWGRPPEPAPEPAEPADRDPADSTKDDPPAGPDRRSLRLVPEPDSAAAGTEPDPAPRGDATSTEDTDMAITTTTGGEVLTMDQLLAELGTIIEEAAADLEDAQADAQRATEDAQRVETMVASLRSMDLDEQTLGEVGALGDSATARQAAADQRAAAAEARHAQATAARDGVQARHQLMAEAHAATPHAADKQFYVGG